jgi:hypothetical protein
MSKQVKDSGYVLTCSSYVIGDGVSLTLGENDRVWNEMYRGRLEDEQAQYIGRKAMAHVIRRHDEEFPEKWQKKTEKVFKETES